MDTWGILPRGPDFTSSVNIHHWWPGCSPICGHSCAVHRSTQCSTRTNGGGGRPACARARLSWKENSSSCFKGVYRTVSCGYNLRPQAQGSHVPVVSPCSFLACYRLLLGQEKNLLCTTLTLRLYSLNLLQSLPPASFLSQLWKLSALFATFRVLSELLASFFGC